MVAIIMTQASPFVGVADCVARVVLACGYSSCLRSCTSLLQRHDVLHMSEASSAARPWATRPPRRDEAC
eukprot:10776551-Alexandrium_andersonii.AAC.1